MSLATDFTKLKKKAIRLVRGGRSNRRIYGGIYKLPSGQNIYIAYRFRKEIFRSGEKSVSMAHDKGIACWAVDYDTLLTIKNEMIDLVGIYVRDEGDFYLTKRVNFLDKTKATVKNYDARGGALQEYLPLRYFAKVGKSAII